MKIKKVLNQKSDPKVVQMTDIHKSVDTNDLLSPVSGLTPEESINNTSCGQSSLPTNTTDAKTRNDTNSDIRSGSRVEEDLIRKMPALKLLPDFHLIECKFGDLSIAPLPPLKSLPVSGSPDCEIFLEPIIDPIVVPTINPTIDPIVVPTINPTINPMIDPMVDSTNTTNVSFENQMTNNFVNYNNINQNEEQILNSSLILDLDRIIGDMPEILDALDINTTPIEVNTMPSLVSNSSVTNQIPFNGMDVTPNVQNSGIVTESSATNVTSTQVNASNASNCDHNFVDTTQSSTICADTSKANQSMTEKVVSIDLSNSSNSPQSVIENNDRCQQMPINDSPIPSTSSAQNGITSTQTKETVNRLENGISRQQTTEQNARLSQHKLNATVPHFKYCAKDYRYFNLFRTSARNKTTTNNEDYDYENDMLAKASWDQIDGTQYEVKVSKWSEDSMDEERRKDILRGVEQMKFDESVYKEDVNVFYCWNAFEGQSSRTEGQLKCLMRLDPKGVKHSRFAKYYTRLYLLSGQAVVISEGKPKKSVEGGHEVTVPPHTRYELEARGVESNYFYVIISNY